MPITHLLEPPEPAPVPPLSPLMKGCLAVVCTLLASGVALLKAYGEPDPRGRMPAQASLGCPAQPPGGCPEAQDSCHAANSRGEPCPTRSSSK